MALPGRRPDRPEQRIGRYLITGRIGQGGMGLVYRGRDDQLERDVAVKTLTREGSLDAESLQRFGVEAKAAARLQHPNIVTIYELGEDRGLKYIAMELMGGVDLETLMRSPEPLLLEEKLEIVLQVCRGLAYAHDRGIVHRDLKPSNIRVLDDGSAKLMDFGIAKLSGTNLTKSGMMVGTVHYMSPEQIRGGALDGRSDVFSMGVILHELLAGSRPFPGQEPTAVLYKIVHAEPEPLPAELGPPRLRGLVERSLAKDPQARTPGAAALADELQAVLDELRAARVPRGRGEDEGLQQTRRLLADGQAEEGLRWLREAVARDPESLPLRRELRRALREEQAGTRSAAPDEFPELLATFQASPTQLAPGPPTEALPASAPVAPQPETRRVSRPLLAAAAGVPVLLLLAAVVLLARRAPVPAAVVLDVRSRPAGARVLVDGQDSGVRTDGRLTLPPGTGRVRLSFEREGYRESSLSLSPPFDTAPLQVTLEPLPEASARVRVETDPQGASVALDGAAPLGRTPLDVPYDPSRPHRLTLSLAGHRSEELQIPQGERPARLSAVLESDGPRGFVALSAPYPLDVSYRGRTLVKSQTQVRLSLPEGRQTLIITAPRYFLRSEATLQVPGGGEVAWRAPALGRLNVRASPDSCQVLLNGSFFDYPPILDRPVAAGRLTVGFKWPDGVQTSDSVDLEPGGVAFVTGRKP